MNVTIICGSPREGGNTEQLLSILDKELNNKNIKTEFIKLGNMKINRCTHCDGCKNHNKCMQKDDFNYIYDIVLNNKGLVIGSPVYVGTPTSLVMAFIQRLTYVSFNNNSQLVRKIGAPITIAGETGQLATINCLIDFYLVNGMVIVGSSYWNIGVGSNKGDILNDEKGEKYIKDFSSNLVYVLNDIKE